MLPTQDYRNWRTCESERVYRNCELWYLRIGKEPVRGGLGNQFFKVIIRETDAILHCTPLF